MDESITMAWSLASFIAGAIGGGWAVWRISGGAAAGPRVPFMRRGFQWARNDIRIPEPTAENTMIRKVTDWERAADLNVTDRTLTFHIQDIRTGLERDLTYSAALVLRFLKCDTPIRGEWHGDNNDYSRLLAIAKGYGWVIPDSGRYGWAVWLSTRERRLRVLEAWMTAGN